MDAEEIPAARITSTRWPSSPREVQPPMAERSRTSSRPALTFKGHDHSHTFSTRAVYADPEAIGWDNRFTHGPQGGATQRRRLAAELRSSGRSSNKRPVRRRVLR